MSALAADLVRQKVAVTDTVFPKEIEALFVRVLDLARQMGLLKISNFFRHRGTSPARPAAGRAASGMPSPLLAPMQMAGSISSRGRKRQQQRP
jgi:hypothetical protein